MQIKEPAAKKKPWITLIHGLGMSHRSWIEPFRESLLAGAISFDYVLTDLSNHPVSSLYRGAGILACSPPLRLLQNPPVSFWEFLRREGYGVLTWSQEKSRGPIEQALGELQLVLEAIPREDRIVLLGHSRGGLIARRYLQEHRAHWDRISGVVLMGVPNHGSQIAKSAQILERAAFFLMWRGGNRPIFRPLPGRKAGFPFHLIRAFSAYGREGGIKELTPLSAFMRLLASQEREECKNKIPYFNLSGNRTDFTRIYLRPCRRGKVILTFSLLDGLEKIIPRALLPPEIQQGKGDGQVSVKSAHLDWAEKNQILPVNHAQFLVAAEVQREIQLFLETGMCQ